MRTTLAIILVWAAATAALCIGGLKVVSALMKPNVTSANDPIFRLTRMMAEDAEAAYQEGGDDRTGRSLQPVTREAAWIVVPDRRAQP